MAIIDRLFKRFVELYSALRKTVLESETSFSALTPGELSEGLRGLYQAPSLRELSAKLTEGVTYFPFSTLLLFSIPIFFTHKKSLNLTFLSARCRGITLSAVTK